ncbi:threonine aldolase family protein [Undibacter mobilis]|uniref:L-threonine aldolase n=1 Tax=Undibacter mobilis TaxID=2292256 RepID=A0A371B2Y2_9BRAD|nr:low specificity L-threonine aldolase [Undibacter mobilis]RDV01821.1 low specificity L-threonine aldolase [Undibacter mobilis]
MNFASDNTAGVAPEIMAALAHANNGFTLGYGNDEATRRVEKKFCALFERDVAVFLVPTGTVANALALAHVTPPWGAVLCHQNSHIAVDECGAPEFFGGGIKLLELPGDNGKIAADTLKARLGNKASWGPPHHVAPAAVSISQASESGTIYRVADIRALADIAHEHGAVLHMDGARFGNALVRLNVSAAEMTWKAGVDVLSFGATKCGAMAAEAVIFFDPKRAEGMSARRKRGGALLSKHRFIAAQMEAFLDGDLWLRLARHANSMADRLSDGLTKAGFAPVWPVEANEVFAALPVALCDKLQAAGAVFYRWDADNKGNVIVRLVTSFQTTVEEVDRFTTLVSAG